MQGVIKQRDSHRERNEKRRGAHVGRVLWGSDIWCQERGFPRKIFIPKPCGLKFMAYNPLAQSAEAAAERGGLPSAATLNETSNSHCLFGRKRKSY